MPYHHSFFLFCLFLFFFRIRFSLCFWPNNFHVFSLFLSLLSSLLSRAYFLIFLYFIRLRAIARMKIFCMYNSTRCGLFGRREKSTLYITKIGVQQRQQQNTKKSSKLQNRNISFFRGIYGKPSSLLFHWLKQRHYSGCISSIDKHAYIQLHCFTGFT